MDDRAQLHAALTRLSQRIDGALADVRSLRTEVHDSISVAAQARANVAHLFALADASADYLLHSPAEDAALSLDRYRTLRSS